MIVLRLEKIFEAARSVSKRLTLANRTSDRYLGVR